MQIRLKLNLLFIFYAFPVSISFANSFGIKMQAHPLKTAITSTWKTSTVTAIVFKLSSALLFALDFSSRQPSLEKYTFRIVFFRHQKCLRNKITKFMFLCLFFSLTTFLLQIAREFSWLKLIVFEWRRINIEKLLLMLCSVPVNFELLAFIWK